MRLLETEYLTILVNLRTISKELDRLRIVEHESRHIRQLGLRSTRETVHLTTVETLREIT